MGRFYEGDIVLCISGSEKSGLIEGTHYSIKKSLKNGIVVLNENGSHFSEHRFELVDDEDVQSSDISSGFENDDEVVCIDAEGYSRPTGLEEGKVYRVHLGDRHIVNLYGFDRWFYSSRFKLVEEEKEVMGELKDFDKVHEGLKKQYEDLLDKEAHYIVKWMLEHFSSPVVAFNAACDYDSSVINDLHNRNNPTHSINHFRVKTRVEENLWKSVEIRRLHDPEFSALASEFEEDCLRDNANIKSGRLYGIKRIADILNCEDFMLKDWEEEHKDSLGGAPNFSYYFY